MHSNVTDFNSIILQVMILCFHQIQQSTVFCFFANFLMNKETKGQRLRKDKIPNFWANINSPPDRTNITGLEHPRIQFKKTEKRLQDFF